MLLLLFSGSTIQLVPDGTLLFHLAVVLVMVVVLNATLLKPINRVLEERERRTKGRFAEAQQLVETVGGKLREYESALRDARARGYALADEERKAASAERDNKVSAVRAEVASWLERERVTLAQDQEQVKASLLTDAQARAAEISVQILKRPLQRL